MHRAGLYVVLACAVLWTVGLPGCKGEEAGPAPAVETSPPPAPSEPENPPEPPASPSGAEPGDAEKQAFFDRLLSQEPVAEQTIIVKPKGFLEKPKNTTGFPTEAEVRWFIGQMQRNVQDRNLRFLLMRMPEGVKLRFTLAGQVKEFTRDEWFAQAMTSLQVVQKYGYYITDHKFRIDGKKVHLELWIVEQYEDEDGKMVKGETYQTMELLWRGDDFLIQSMIGESTGEPID